MKKTVNTVWFLNLAVADFLFTAFLPLSVTYTALGFHWPFGNFMCKLNSTISFLNMFASVYILVVISVDRCVSVVSPVWAQNHRNVRKASYVSLGVWVLALILSAPYFIFKDTAPYSEDVINCFTNYGLSDDYETPSVVELRHFRHQAMTLTRFLLGFVVPFTVIVSSYAVIIHHLRRNRTLSSQSTTSLAFLNSCLNPLLYVFMGQDFKDKVRKSILNVLETAFQEVSRSYTYTNSMVTSRSKENSIMEANTTLFNHNNTDDEFSYFVDEYDQLRKAFNIISIIVYCLAFVLGVIGNGVVIWVTGFKMKKTVNTVWFLNLAIADLLFTAFLPVSVTYTALNFHWPFGNFMCKLNSGITYLNMFASIYILVVISMDRCVSVVWPVWAQNHRNVRKASYVSLGVWVLALILSAPYVVFRDTAPSLLDEEYISCFNNFVLSNNLTQSVIELANLRHQAMTLTRFFLGFFIPFTVIVSSYAVIIHRLRRNRTLSSQSSRPFKIIAAVIITFFLCWTPFHIMGLIELVHFTISPTFYYVLSIGSPIATSLAFVNSCLNPLLYVFMGQDFKDKIRKSILNILETAFQEDETHSFTDTKSADISQTSGKSAATSALDDHHELEKSLNIMSVIIYCLAFVLGVIGNGVVIWVTGFKMKKTVNTVWFLNLAVADFLFTAFLPLSVTYTALGFHWPFGNFMCKLNSGMTSLNMFASIYILVVISMDRCVSVVWPVWAQNHRNVRKASYVSLGVWVLALILSAPYVVFKDTTPPSLNEEYIKCFNNFALSNDSTQSGTELEQLRHQAMTLTRFFLGFVVPFTIIVSSYTVIIHRLRRNRTLSSQSSRPFKIIAAVIITFFLCWTPFHIMGLIELAHFTISPTFGLALTIGTPITISLAFVNSCLNPLLYVFMGQDFKDKVRKSILSVLETVFQEEVSPSHTYTNSIPIGQSKPKSVSDVEARFKRRMEMNNLTFFYDGNYSFVTDDDYYIYSDDLAELRKSLNIMSIIINCLAFIFGVIGNGVVIWVTGFKMKKTVKTVWFLNLAVADFLFTAFLPLNVIYAALGFHWPFGNFMCKLNSGMTSLNMFASVYILVVISVDRCVSVVWPVWAQNHRNVRKASYVSLGVWVLALILSAPYFIFRDTTPSPHNEEYIICYINFARSNNYTQSVIELVNLRHQAMTLTRFFLGFLIPSTVIVSSYTVIIHRLRRNRTLSSQSSRPFKIIAVVIITFFLCWAPFHIMELIELVHFTISPRFYYALTIGTPIAICLIFLNSCINPVLYVFMGQDFKDTLFSPTFHYALTIGTPITISLAFVNSCLNPLLYVFMGQDFKDKVRKSILSVLETAFQEEARFKTRMEMNNLTFFHDDYLAELKKSLDIMSIIISCLAFIFGVLGNGVVIWVTGFKMKKTVNTVWFLNLAVADFLFTAFLPLSVTYTALGFYWPFGNFMCKLNNTIQFLNMFASIYILVVISVDRCVSVVWPVWAQNHRNVRKASYVSLGVWVLALILSAPYFVFKDTAPSPLNEEYIICFNNFVLSNNLTQSVIELTNLRHKAMTLTCFFLGFFIPFTVIVSSYAVIIHRLRRNRTLSSQSSRPFKIIAAVIITFFLCWTPFHIMQLIELVHFTVSPRFYYALTIGTPITISLVFVNSCLNPLLYVFMGQDFKDKVRKSILSVLETVFQEEVSPSHTYTNSITIGQSKKSVSDAE
ncbi:hypothetical protein INR49_024626, partial [Caranx melampygus]